MTRELDSVLRKAARDPELAGIIAAVERPSVGLRWAASTGEADVDRQFFVASTTKLHTTAIVLRLAERRLLRLDDRIVDHLGMDAIERLHVHHGVDHTTAVTVEHLLSQTSGIGDYFEGRPAGGTSLERSLVAGNDTAWTRAEALDMARQVGPAFPPGAKRRALYSDTNFQLLGMVIERLTGQSYEETLHAEVIEPLRLDETYLYSDPADARPLPLRYGPNRLVIPEAMASFGPDGGVVSTASDLMRFVRAFFEGGLFDAAVLPSLQRYNRIFFPLQYGVGFARFSVPRALSPFGSTELVGHSGLSGAFAFLAPASGTYVTGTVNNIRKPGRSFRLMLRLVQAAGR